MYLRGLIRWIKENTTITVIKLPSGLEVPIEKLDWLFNEVVEDEFPIEVRNRRQRELLDPLFESGDEVDAYLDDLSTQGDSYVEQVGLTDGLYEALLKAFQNYIEYVLPEQTVEVS